MADEFKKYEKTNLTVTGHTDNVGSADYNLKISERRAKAVADYLMPLGVPQGRMRIMGFGFERPVASNDCSDGRARGGRGGGRGGPGGGRRGRGGRGGPRRAARAGGAAEA